MSVRIEWTCPNCGLTARIRRYPVHCACGYRQKTERRDVLASREYAERLKICEKCENWMDQRCKILELGCSRTWRKNVKILTAACPIYKWGLRPEINRFNLIYHVCALKTNDIWKENLDKLKQRLEIFNGKKTIALSIDPEIIHESSTVKDYISDNTIEYLEIPNNPVLREVVTFLPLLHSVYSKKPNEATFYAHTKGNSTEDGFEGSTVWRNIMYDRLLDNVFSIAEMLTMKPCVGTHKMYYPYGNTPFPTKLAHGNWMFSGTFFWFRNDAVFSKPNWDQIPNDRYGAEAWLSGLFKVNEGISLYQPWSVHKFPTPNPYAVDTYKDFYIP